MKLGSSQYIRIFFPLLQAKCKAEPLVEGSELYEEATHGLAEIFKPQTILVQGIIDIL